MPLQPTYIFENIQKNIIHQKTQNGKVQRPSLQLPQWNYIQGKEECNKSDQCLLNKLENKQRLIARNMKLDLGIIQQNKDSYERTELQQKREKLAHFDKECSQILDHVFLGSESIAKNRKALHDNGITHVLNCVGFICPEYFCKDLTYKTLWLQDSPLEDITSILYDVFDYFEEVRENNGRIFVHCCQGVSRSTSLVIAYLMWIGKYTFENAFQHIKKARGITNPNMGFVCQLLQCQKRVHAMPISPKSTLRMYRIAPHSVYDPMHLVPKTINNPHLCALDSRGAFVVLIPNTFFIWQGSECDTNMAFAAHYFACQVIQYEKAKGKIINVQEGKEPKEFWNAFKRKEFDINTTLNRTIEVDEKKLLNLPENLEFTLKPNFFMKCKSLYDKDFETYMRAKRDKIMPINIKRKLNATIHEPQDSGWTHLYCRYAHKLEKIFLENPKVLDATNILGRKNPIPIVELNLKNYKENIELQPISLSPPNISPNSSTSSPSFHSILSNSSQSPHNMTSPCLSLSPSLTPKDSSIPKTTDIFENDNELIEQNQYTIDFSEESLLQKNLHLNSMPCHFKAFETIDTKINKDTLIEPLKQRKNNCIQNERLASSSQTCSSFQKEEKGESSSSRSRIEKNDESIAPVLFEWPQLEKIDMFDVDDLDSDAAFVLLVSKNFNKSRSCLYFWVGSSLQIKNDQNSKLNDGEIEEQNVEHWQRVGKNIVCQLQLQNDIHIEVIFDGKEPNEFWNYFING